MSLNPAGPVSSTLMYGGSQTQLVTFDREVEGEPELSSRIENLSLVLGSSKEDLREEWSRYAAVALQVLEKFSESQKIICELTEENNRLKRELIEEQERRKQLDLLRQQNEEATQVCLGLLERQIKSLRFHREEDIAEYRKQLKELKAIRLQADDLVARFNNHYHHDYGGFSTVIGGLMAPGQVNIFRAEDIKEEPRAVSPDKCILS